MNKLLNIKNDKLHYNYYMVILFLIIMYPIIEHKFQFYLLINNIMTVAIIIGFIYVNFIRSIYVVRSKHTPFKPLYFNLGCIVIINIISMMLLFFDRKLEYFFLLLSVQAIFEYGPVYKICEFKMKWIEIVLLNICKMFVFTIMFFFISNWANESKYYVYGRDVYTIVILAMGILMSIYILRRVLLNKRNISEERYKIIMLYLLSILLNYFCFGFINISDEFIGCTCIVLKMFMLYKFYQYIIDNSLDESFNIISNEINNARKTKKNLNGILKKRNLILSETNAMIEKTQDKYIELISSIYGGVFMFINDELRYVNNVYESFQIDDNKIIGIELDEFLSKYFGINLDQLLKANNHISCISMKHNDLEVELFLMITESESKVLYIHDISQINENIKIKKELEEYLEEDELKKEFFANISHELKTPINLIFTAIQVNQMFLDEGNLEAYDKNREVIKQNCLRLIRTINNFIDANKISEGYITPEYKINNIVELVENISIGCNKYIKLAQNELIFDSDEEEIYVNCDSEMISRIMLNILSNSIKYGEKGGLIKVCVTTEEKDKVKIKVINSGVKIDEKTMPYIFDKFTKINKAFNRLKEGSGLGLFLAKALIEMQGGSISLNSNNKENEFIIEFNREENISYDEVEHENATMNALEEKIDIEFSDIYI